MEYTRRRTVVRTHYHTQNKMKRKNDGNENSLMAAETTLMRENTY